MLARPCLDCQRPTRQGSRCATCAQVHDAAYERTRLRGTRTQRGYSNTWLRRSRAAIRQQPWCSACGGTNDLTADHVVPLSKGGDGTDVQVLCRACNSRRGNRG